MSEPETAAELQAEIIELRETNRRLNRRANGMDSVWQSRAMLGEAMGDHWSQGWKQSFVRMCAAFAELREIQALVEKARGNMDPRFHSVNDMRFVPDPDKRPWIWANVYIDPIKGGIRSERVVDAVAHLLFAKGQIDA